MSAAMGLLEMYIRFDGVARTNAPTYTKKEDISETIVFQVITL